ncbi:hypothetical protein NGR_c13530 [Sinorhizobium fredii NGR234]|uniref:Uncharacterized protein n=1 Tax=Sinorhizobium fredii (strain NBRC 101917 / NGR234) TaxID=394 RepID=C3MBS1_SINFN|nr:hypothetical protein NGR_c13530 [Sinorhizobium fredii NGR234]
MHRFVFLQQVPQHRKQIARPWQSRARDISLQYDQIS